MSTGPSRDGAPETVPTRGLRQMVTAMMEDHWCPELGWSVPNPDVYPWLWSWDSCFHALVWDALDDRRAVTELASVFAAEHESGFVPHMNYAADPTIHEGFWGVRGVSTLLQPPMYGHALATLDRHGRDVGRLIEPACRGMRYLFERRRAPCGLLRIFHPWESGIDDHPRWAAWQPDPWDRRVWAVVKGRLVAAMTVVDGEAVASSAFDVCPAGFNALVAWNARELAAVADDRSLAQLADDLVATLEQRWDPERLTWADTAPDGTPGSAIRTLDGLLGALVTADPHRVGRALEAALDPGAFGLDFGPSGVHIDEPDFRPDGYGRGGAWPHLTYLLILAAGASGDSRRAQMLAANLVAGAARSGLAEYWDPRDGTGHGACPQTWSGLALTVSANL